MRTKLRALRRACAPALLPLLAAVAAAPAAAQEVYTNPVLARPQGVADPFILKFNGEYYLYATGDPILIYHSTDLASWDEVGPAVASSKAPTAWNQADVWAPEVVYRNGLFYLYYSATQASPDWRVGEMARRVGVAVSESPRGPFVDSGHPVTPGWGIDGHVFRDPDGGDEYLFYSYLYEPRLPGAGIVADRLLTPDRVAGRPAHVVRGSEWWEDKDADPINGSLRYTNEGPTVLKRHGLYYLLYSGGSWDLPTYAMGYAVSDRILPDGGLDGPGWVKGGAPFLRSTPLVQGTGHNTVTRAPNNVDDITAYHARVVPFNSPGDRQTFLDRLYWLHDRPFLEQATLGTRPAPDQPLFADRFDRDGTPGRDWEIVSGSWRAADGQLRGSGRALLNAPHLTHYRFEANVRGPDAGVVAYDAGPDDRVEVWLDPARRALVSAGVQAGRRVADLATPLPRDFVFDAYHQLLVTRNAGLLRIDLDGVHLQEIAVGAGRAAAGLFTRRGSAYFDGVALTAWFEDTFDRPDSTWSSLGGSWLVNEGALHQVAGGAARSIALKGDSAENYEFTASVRLRDSDATGSRVGIVAASNARGELVLAGFDHDIWPFARFSVRHLAGGELRSSLEVEMPRGFQYDAYHTIRVVKQGDAFTFYLDGAESAVARFRVGAAQPGLFTEGARAAFDDVAMKWLTVPQNLILNGGFEAAQWTASATQPAAGAAWQVAGRASLNLCCGHTDTHRLLISAADGRATQLVDGLSPGDYTLHAWVNTRGAEAVVEAAPAGGAAQRAIASDGAWHRVELNFAVPAPESGATISLTGHFTDQPGAFIAVDDVYLFRREP
jgi:GH43 family beta-xylosidase